MPKGTKTRTAKPQSGPPAIEKIARQVTRPGREVVIPVKATTSTDSVVFELVDSSNGATIDEASGEFRWTPRQTESESVAFNVQATDSDGESSSMSFEIGVADNEAPEIEAIDDQEIGVGQPFTQQVDATDPEGGELTYTLEDPVPTGFTIGTGGMIAGKLFTAGTVTIEVRVTDQQNAFATESFDLTGINQGPEITEINDQNIGVGLPFNQQVQATDPLNQGLTYELVDPVPPGFSIGGGGMITGMLFAPQTVSIEVRVTDQADVSAFESFDLTAS